MSIATALNYLQEAAGQPFLLESVKVERFFKEIAARSGKAAEAHLQAAMNNHDTAISALCKACLVLGMSPFITYGVGAQTVPAPNDGQLPYEGELWGPETVNLLTALASRELTGHAARDAIEKEFARLCFNSRELLYRVLVKEMRIGCGPKTVNKYHRNLVPVFELKGAQRTKEALHKVKWPCWAEYKLDGYRGIVKTDGKSFETFSRNGLPLPNLDYRAADLVLLTRALIAEGILTSGWWAWDGEGKKDGHFNLTGSEARKAGKGEDLRFHIFDLIPWEHLAGGTEPIETRHARLDQVQAFINATTAGHACYTPMLRTVERFELDEEADAWELYNQARELGHEGLILKQKGSLYNPGKTVDWVKVKPEETVDLVCTGTYPGEKGSKLEGLIGGLEFNYKGVKVRAGSGLTDEDRARPSEHFVGRVFEIIYHEETPDGSLREPRVKGERKDKYPEDADK